MNDPIADRVMQPIPISVSTLPPHDAAPRLPLLVHRVAEWAVGTFVENLAVARDGTIYVSVLSEARIDRVSPAGDVARFAQLDAPPTGLAFLGGGLYAAVGAPGGERPALWRFDRATGAGERVLTVAGARFLNGLTPLAGGVLLAAESELGRVYRLEPGRREWRVWLEDERLTPSPHAPMLPGANGIKAFGGSVTVSSNSRALLLRVPVMSDGEAGPPVVVAERLRADDFAFAADGTLFLTTHLGASLDRLSPDGTRVSVAGPGPDLAGSTACAFGRTAADSRSLYVTTTGGLLAPDGATPAPARLLRVDVGVERHPLEVLD